MKYEKNEKNKLQQQPVILGKGGFGTVKLALSLIKTDKVNAGKLLCVKKTKPASNSITY